MSRRMTYHDVIVNTAGGTRLKAIDLLATVRSNQSFWNVYTDWINDF